MKNISKSIINCCMLLIFFFMGIFHGCAIISPIQKDNGLKPYINKFVKEMNIGDHELFFYSIRFHTLDYISPKEGSLTIGYCLRPMIFKTIYIDPKYWFSYRMSEKRKTILMYHELAHAYYNLDHIKGDRKDGCPISIMNPTIPDNYCMVKHWDSYMEKFKKRRNK